VLSSNGYGTGISFTNVLELTTPDFKTWTSHFLNFPNLTATSPNIFINGTNMILTPKLFTTAGGNYGFVVEVNTNMNANSSDYTPYYSMFTDSTFTNVSPLTNIAFAAGVNQKHFYNQEIYVVGTNNILMADDVTNRYLNFFQSKNLFGPYYPLMNVGRDVLGFGQFENFSLVHVGTNHWAIFGTSPTGNPIVARSDNFSTEAALQNNFTNGWTPLKLVKSSNGGNGGEASTWVSLITNPQTVAQAQSITVYQFSDVAGWFSPTVGSMGVPGTLSGTFVQATPSAFSSVLYPNLNGLTVSDVGLYQNQLAFGLGIATNITQEFSVTYSGGIDFYTATPSMLDAHVYEDVANNNFAAWEYTTNTGPSVIRNFAGMNGHTTEQDADKFVARTGFSGPGSGLTDVPVSAITGGFNTNILVGGHTFYITNGIIMNVQ
jgi:hypothetical protein